MTIRRNISTWLGGSMSACIAFSCGAPPPPECPETTSAPARTDLASAEPAAAAASPGLDVRVVPKPAESSIEVTTTATSKGAELRSWSLASGGAALRVLAVEDDAGAVPHTKSPLPNGGARLDLERLPSGSVVVRHRIAAAPMNAGADTPSALDPNRMIAHGENLFLLPDSFEDRAVPTRLRIDPGYWGENARAASSLGAGDDASIEVAGRGLRRTTLLAGQLGHAQFEAPEGIDHAAWLGFTNFDGRAVAAEVAGFRTAARQYFDARQLSPLTLLIVATNRSEGDFTAARRTTSVLVSVGLKQAWDGPLRMSVAHQVLREWIGSELFIAPKNPRTSLESIWFVEGVNRYLARELLFRFGLLTPDEYLEEVEALLRLYVTSDMKSAPLDQLSAPAPQRRSDAVTALVVRGALYATFLDAQIRRRSKGKDSLDRVFRDLFKQAREKPGPLDHDAWTAAVDAYLPGRGKELHRRLVLEGATIELPATALGPCFAPRNRNYTSFDLGYELATKDGTEVLASVPATGPAHRAGLRPGDVLKQADFRRDDPSRKARVTVERAGQRQRFEYLPAGALVRGQGFVRLRGKKDEECNRR